MPQVALLQELQYLENRRHSEYHEPTEDEVEEALKWQLDFRNQHFVGDALVMSRKLPSNSVDLIITSPPYFAVRDYGIYTIIGGDPQCTHEWLVSHSSNRNNRSVKFGQGFTCHQCGARKEQLGLESIFDCMILFWNGQIDKNDFPCGKCYLCKMVQIFRELHRVLKPTGILYLNIGDTFFGTGFGQDKNIRQTKTATNGGIMHNREEMRNLRIYQSRLKYYRDSCLCLIPERLATALVDRIGFWLRGKPIWDKQNGMPSSAENRYTLNYENVYMFTKSRNGYYFNRELVREKLKESTIIRDKYPVGTFKHDAKTGAHHSRHSETYKQMNFVDDLSDVPEQFEPITVNRKFGGKRQAGHNGNPTYSKKKWVIRDKYKNPGSVWHMSTRSFGREYCVPCDRLRPKSELIEICIECGYRFPRVSKSHAGNPRTRSSPRAREVQQNRNIYVGWDSLEDDDVCPKCQKETDHDLICFECKTVVHQHYAMFSEEFVLRMMKAGAPRSCCAECGMPKFPVVKPSAEYAKYLGKGYHKHTKDSRAGMMQRKQVKSVSADYRIVGYEARCKCNAGFVPGLVLDPFAGFFTVSAVAQKWGIDYCGFDIDQRNVSAGNRRIADDKEKLKGKPSEFAKLLEIDLANGE